jgi:hypothetical protein
MKKAKAAALAVIDVVSWALIVLGIAIFVAVVLHP